MKRRNKRIILSALALALVLLLTLTAFISCTAGGDDGKIKILCTVFPQYDWVKNIVGDTEGIEVSLLVESGADVHSYQPSFDDMVKIKQSDLVIYIGGESDKWVSDALYDAEGTALALSECEGIVLREVSDGHIFSEHSHGNGKEEHTESFDEHIWLSLRNAEAASRAICEELCKIDGENAERYRENTEKYRESLLALDEDFKSAAEAAQESLILFADRFPFVYLLEDYGISYVAAFSGCSTDTDADFDTVIRLAKKLEEQKLSCVAVTESADKSLADKVIYESGRECSVLVFDSMQSVTEKKTENGYSYIWAMEHNLGMLKTALNVKLEK